MRIITVIVLFKPLPVLKDHNKLTDCILCVLFVSNALDVLISIPTELTGNIEADSQSRVIHLIIIVSYNYVLVVKAE